jgi:hypothetical protein
MHMGKKSADAEASTQSGGGSQLTTVGRHLGNSNQHSLYVKHSVDL